MGQAIVRGRTSGKVQGLDQLARTLDGQRTEDKRIVVCHGVFDLLHPGHIRHLKSAKREGDILVVSITADAFVRKGPGRPVFNEMLRAETLAALEVVDYVCLVHDYNALPCIRKLKPDVYAKGPDYGDVTQDPTGEIVEEEKAVLAGGGKLFITDDVVVLSSTRLINEHVGVLSDVQKSFVMRITEKYPADGQVIDSIKRLKELKVMVIGDAIVDEYVYCEPLGQSLKQQLVVHEYLSEERFCGGALAVANQIAEFCKEVAVVTVLGAQNSFEDYLHSGLRQNVKAQMFLRDDAPTVVKRRYVYTNVERKVFEVCHIQDRDMPVEIEADAVSYVADNAPEYDLVVISDYGHGAVTPRVVQQARKSARFLAVNAQSNSANMGYNLITKKYSGLDFACIDEAEARLALQDKYAPVEELGPELLRALDSERLIVTRGDSGSLAFDRSGEVLACPAFAMNVVDRVGAGDAFFSVTAGCFALGMPADVVSLVGNAVGALAVHIVGNREPVAPRDVYRLLSHLLVA